MEIITRISGPEPGYIACSIFIVQASRQRGWTGRFVHLCQHARLRLLLLGWPHACSHATLPNG